MSALSDSLPGLRLLRQYDRGWLRSDVVAGVVLAAYLLPAGIGDASLAGLPPEAGLAGAERLEELHDAMLERGIAFRLAEARGGVRETLRRVGFEQRYGPLVPNQPVATVIEQWRADAKR